MHPLRLPFRVVPSLCAALVATLPAVAGASCFTIVDARNRPVYQSTTSPVDLTGSISASMARRYANGFLIISPNNACTGIGDASRGGDPASLLRASSSDLDYAGTSPAPQTAPAAQSPFPAETVDDGAVRMGRRGFANPQDTAATQTAPTAPRLR